LAQIHFELDNIKHKQLKVLAFAKGVTVSSLVRSYVEYGMNEALNKQVEISGTSLESSSLLQQKHNGVVTILHKNKENCFQSSIIAAQTCSQYPKPRNDDELNEWHKLFFAECFLDAREPLLCDPTGFAIYEPFSLMAVANKDKLVKCMLDKNEKKFRVYESMAHHIVDKMIRLKVIAPTSIMSGDLLACPLLLLDCIVKRAARSSSSCSENGAQDRQLQIQRTATMAAAKI
jgi:hypothetical protein